MENLFGETYDLKMDGNIIYGFTEASNPNTTTIKVVIAIAT